MGAALAASTCFQLYMLFQFTLKKYFDLTLPYAQVLPTTISKVNTAIQLLLVAMAITAPIFDLANHTAYHALW